MTTVRVPIACCSFCQKPNTAVETLISGPGVSICSKCVSTCQAVLESRPAESARQLPATDDLTMEQILGLLPNVVAAGEHLERSLADWVRKARGLGATWAQIGETLGMTRQSAWERFSRLPRSGP